MYPTQTGVSRNLKYQCRHQAGSENQYWAVTKQWAAFPNVQELQTYMYYLWDLKLQTHTAAAFNTPHVPFFQNVKATNDHFIVKLCRAAKLLSVSIFWKQRIRQFVKHNYLLSLETFETFTKTVRPSRARSILFNSISTCKCRIVLTFEISFAGVAICCTLLTSFLLTLTPLTWKIWWDNNASRWQMGFNSAFKRLITMQFVLEIM